MIIFSVITKFFKKGGYKARVAMQWIAFARSVRPKIRFHSSNTPEAPDYQSLDFWAAHPDVENKSRFKPQGVGLEDPTGDPEADVFYIHPTTYFGTQSWNSPMDHPHANEIVDELIMASQASVFNSCCNIYAPRYRQATFFSFLRGSYSGRKALELGYSDLARAFDHYIKHWNRGRPFFIAGHSQGALHALRLLEEKIDKSDIRERMIAAYVIGFRVPEDKFKTGFFQHLFPSQSPTDINSVIAWDTYSDNGGPSHWTDKAEHWYNDGTGTWVPRAHKRPISTNPLHWKNTFEEADESHNMGAVHIMLDSDIKINWAKWGGDDALGINSIGLSKPYKNEVAARLKEDGFLYISWPKSKVFTLMVMPGGNFHNYDISLFYMNIRQNIRDRLQAFKAGQQKNNIVEIP